MGWSVSEGCFRCHAGEGGHPVIRRRITGSASRGRRSSHVKLAPVAMLAALAHSPAPTFGPSACTRVTLKRPSAHTTVMPSASTATISPSLPAMPFGSLRGHRLGVEDLHGLAVERRPGAGRRIAAADQPVDLLPRLAPVDVGVAGAAAAFVGRLRFVLLDARRLAGLHQVDAFQHRLDAHREQAVEIDRAERVGGARSASSSASGRRRYRARCRARRSRARFPSRP